MLEESVTDDSTLSINNYKYSAIRDCSIKNNIGVSSHTNVLFVNLDKLRDKKLVSNCILVSFVKLQSIIL